MNILKLHNCNKVLFAGKVNKPNFLKLKLDFKGIYYMPKIIKASKIGDAAILKEVISIFKSERIKTINSLYFNPELGLAKGTHTITKPNVEDKKDIKKAVLTLNKLNNYSFSQGCVVRDDKVLGIERSGGTQKMLNKIKKKKGFSKGVLVKFPKKKQDLRIDLPAIGLKTITQCKGKNLKGIVLKNKQNIFLDKKKLINFANKNKMFISIL